MNATRVVGRFVRGAAALLVILGASVAVGIQPSIAAIDLAQQRQFDIAPQQLSSALLKFSAQSDIQVTVPGQLAEGKQSPGVVGKFNAGSALAILLKDTTLHYDVVDGSTVVITGPAERKAAMRSDYQKVNDPVLAAAMAPSGQEIKLAQAPATTAQTPSIQNPSAAASTSATTGPNPDLAEITVTGTSIKGLDAETALPVTVLRAEDIARTGATSAEDLFRYIS